MISHWYRHTTHSPGGGRQAASSRYSPQTEQSSHRARACDFQVSNSLFISFSTSSPLLSWANSASWQYDHKIKVITSLRRNAMRENRAGCQPMRVMLFRLYHSTDTRIPPTSIFLCCANRGRLGID